MRARLMAAMAVLALAQAASAHELTASVTLAAPAVIVRASYGGVEPAAFVRVQVFAPAAPVEFQTGMTDRRGAFSFVPDGPGKWRLVVDDEEGHRREALVDVPSPFEGARATGGDAGSGWERALLGVALLIGASGFLYGYKATKASVGGRRS